MKLDYLNNNRTKDRKEIVSVGLLGVSVVMVVLIVTKVTGFLAAPARAEKSVKIAVEHSKTDANDMEKYFAESKAIADELKKNNLFAPPPPKKHPVNQVLGILGSEALINGKWYKVGDRIGDAKVVAIEPTQVRIEWDGGEKVFAPMQAGSSTPGSPGRGGPPAKEAGESKGAEMVVVGPDRRRGPGRGEGFRGMRERFENMTEEERRAFRERMRERFGGRDRGSDGRRGGRGGGY